MSKKNSVVGFISASFKGISQVLFIENVITGIIILLAITSTSFLVGMVALLSAIIGTAIGKIGGADEQSINQGLHGYNPVLTGIALTLFLAGPYHWAIALLGAVITAIFTAGTTHLMRNLEIPVLTFPFVIVTWVMLLASYKLQTFKLIDGFVPITLSEWKLDIAGKGDWLEGFMIGFGQIFFLGTLLAGILILVAIFSNGWKYGLYAMIGNMTGLLTAYLIGAELNLVFIGLYSYNAILTIFAVSIVFATPTNRFSTISGIFGASLSVIITASLATFFLPFSLPVLTMPFVLSAWLFLFARKILPKL